MQDIFCLSNISIKHLKYPGIIFYDTLYMTITVHVSALRSQVLADSLQNTPSWSIQLSWSLNVNGVWFNLLKQKEKMEWNNNNIISRFPLCYKVIEQCLPVSELENF